MAIIHVLEKQVAELIAAGEVVERPASIVKELCENSIDAGASSVTVEIRRGGVTYLRITDNGSGIGQSEAPKAFLRHATSKVSSADDLAEILTLGFRGEALASVAAVCRVEMLSRTAEENVGTRYVIEGGEELLYEEAGCPVGTTIVVRDIFYNTPARMKFLKKDITEGNSVAAVVDKLALSHPEISFKLIRDGEQKLQTPGDGQLLSAIYAVYGKEFAGGMVPVDYENSLGLKLTGYISKPECSRATRTQQNFFINSRYIRSRTCAAALEESYRHSIMVGKFPYCVLNLDVSAAAVDVNVHPAKTEVRFADEKVIFDLVYYGCKNTLSRLGNITAAADRMRGQNRANLLKEHAAPVTGEQQHFTADQYRRLLEQEKNGSTKPILPNFPPPGPVTGVAGTTSSPSVLTASDSLPSYPSTSRTAPLDEDLWRPKRSDRSLRWESDDGPAPEVVSVPSTAHEAVTTLDMPLRQVGEIFDTYILLEGDAALVLVDKHAAHERILFEKLKREASQGDRQLLLSPVTVTLDKDLYSAAIQNLSVYESLGFLAEDFGSGALLIREAPVELAKGDITALAEEIANKLFYHSRELTPQVLDDLYHSIACRSAVKAGNKQTPFELAQIIRLVGEDPSIRNCPHGRPLAISLTRKEIEKLFGRI